MKFIEEQLVSVLREMPLETDCTLSVDALDLAGIRGTATQALWLNLRRAAVGNRGWRLSGTHWEYGATPIDLPPRGQLSYAMPPRLVSRAPAQCCHAAHYRKTVGTPGLTRNEARSCGRCGKIVARIRMYSDSGDAQ